MVLSVGKINLFGKELATHNDNKVRLFDIFFVNYLLWSFIGIPVQILIFLLTFVTLSLGTCGKYEQPFFKRVTQH